MGCTLALLYELRCQLHTICTICDAMKCPDIPCSAASVILAPAILTNQDIVKACVTVTVILSFHFIVEEDRRQTACHLQTLLSGKEGCAVA